MTTLPRPLRFTLRVLEKIGAPAVGAVLDSAARTPASGTAPPTAREAETIATLMRQSAEMALKLDSLKDFEGTPEEADSFRLGLTAVSAKVISDLYRMTGAPPAANDLAKAANCFETVRLFANQFVTANDAPSRLAALSEDFIPLDAAQSQLNVLMALAPLVHAVATFSFGQDPQMLVRTQTDLILERADAMLDRYFQSLAEDERRYARLSCVRALAQLYAQAHMMETGRMMSSGAGSAPAADPAQALDQVRHAFDNRVQLLMALVAHTQGATPSSTPRPAATAAAQATAPSPPPSDNAAPASTGAKPAIFGAKPTAPPPSQEGGNDTEDKGSGDTSSGQGGQGGSPMSFFVKK